MPSGLNANAINNNVLASAVSGVPNPAISNIQVSPVISELVPSLQYGDINMVGDLPIGGTIKVSGCFPVYGMISVDGNVPSSGTAVVSESIGNQYPYKHGPICCLLNMLNMPGMPLIGTFHGMPQALHSLAVLCKFGLLKTFITEGKANPGKLVRSSIYPVLLYGIFPKSLLSVNM
ncbi:unnamed protein product [Colias eurytheme]|nr:unnamed protein product [Colias eurytheme]